MIMKITKYTWRDDAGNIVLITRRRRNGLSTDVMLICTTSGFEIESDVSSAVAADALKRMRNQHKKETFYLP